MAVKVKFLKQILSLKKQGCSNEVCIQAILQGCKTDHEIVDTIEAFYQEGEIKPIKLYCEGRDKAYQMLNLAYLDHLAKHFDAQQTREEELPME